MPFFSSQTHPDPAATAAALAADFARWLMDAPGRPSVAFSGGRTPELLFSILAQPEYRTLPWRKLRCFWVDERWVPHDSPESNFGNAWRRLFQPIGYPEAELHPMTILPTQDPRQIPGEAKAAAKRYGDLLGRQLPPPHSGKFIFDLVLLGLGTDGHTASLFPGMDLKPPAPPCIAVQHPATGAMRLTLTMPVINQAKTVVFLVTGADKADTVQAVRNNRDPSLPASSVNPASGPAAWYLDAAATAANRGSPF